MRGPLAVRSALAPTGVPVARSRAQRFDDLVLDAVELVERRFPEELDGVEFAVEDVPDVRAMAAADGVALGSATQARADRPARIVIFRRPIELRALGFVELADLVRDVVVEQIADLLGMPPEDVDPTYDDPDDPEV